MSNNVCKAPWLLACAVGSAASFPSFAQDSPDHPTQIVFPSNGASSSDEVFVLYSDGCGYSPSSERAPEVTEIDGGYQVDVYVDGTEELCFTGPPPDILGVSLGTLPKGFYSLVRHVHIRHTGEADYMLAHQNYGGIEIGDAPNPSASGWWYDPQTPGWGVMLNQLPPAPGEFRGSAALYLATHGDDGAQRWLIGTGRFEDAVLTAVMGDASDGDLATAVFSYTGCGAAILQLEGEGLPTEEVALVQLTRVDGIADCSGPAASPAPQ